jgi:hypothetical protein
LPRFDAGTTGRRLEKLSAIVDERRQDESAERQAREEHQKKIAEYAEMLKAAGIDPAELVNTVVPENTKVSKRAPRPAKYRYLDNGVEKPGPVRAACPRSLPRPLPKANLWKPLPSDCNISLSTAKKTSQGEVFYCCFERWSASVSRLDPEDLRGTRRYQQVSGDGEKPVAQPVEVGQNGRIHPLYAAQPKQQALAATGQGTHHMCLGRRPRTARQNKIAQHRQPGTVGIDLLLEPVRPSLIHLPQRIRLRFTGKCQLPAQIKQLLLQQYEIGQECALPTGISAINKPIWEFSSSMAP